jgi:hypothetical protein
MSQLLMGTYILEMNMWCFLRAPKSLGRLKLSLSTETSEKLGTWGTLLILSILKG